MRISAKLCRKPLVLLILCGVQLCHNAYYNRYNTHYDKIVDGLEFSTLQLMLFTICNAAFH